MLNPGIAPDAGPGSAGKYLVFMSSGLSIFLRSSFFKRLLIQGCLSINKIVFSVLLIVFIVAVHSIIISPYELLSVLKIS
jgi:hypothetical protein